MSVNRRMFLGKKIGKPGEVTNGDVLYRRFLKFFPGIEPGKNLPGKANLLAPYCPKDYFEKL